MASIRRIRGRIKSAKNIAQITKAMELVAASKMKKAQDRASSGKLYAQKIYDLVMRLMPHVDASSNPLLSLKISSKKKLIILISTNKGLCGGLNTNLFRFFLKNYSGSDYDFLTVGKKGWAMSSHMRASVVADFSQTQPFYKNTPAITQFVVAEFLAGKYQSVDLIYNEFISALKQVPKSRRILPLTLGGEVETGEKKSHGEISVEPNSEAVLAELLPHYLENQIRDSLLQSEAAEHSARMVAMRNATDNAISLMNELTLIYNKARQEKITYEISDMVTARLAFE